MKKTLLVASIAFLFALPANAQYTTNSNAKNTTSYTTQQYAKPTAVAPSFRPTTANPTSTTSNTDDLPSFNAMNNRQNKKTGFAQPSTNKAYSGSSATQQAPNFATTATRQPVQATTATRQPVQELVPPPKGEVLVYMTNFKVIELMSGGVICDFDVVVQNNTDQTLKSFGANIVLGKNEHLILMKNVAPSQYKIDGKRIQEPNCRSYQGQRPSSIKVRQCIIGATAGKACVPYIKLR